MADIPSHHMIYGDTTDFVTGELITDTDDERYRQQLARFLVNEKGYRKEDLEVRLKIETLFAGTFVVSKIDIVVRIDGRRLMMVRYAPGSLVTRERPALAAARVLDREQIIPLTIVTNARDAEILDTETGRVTATGLDAIPNREQLVELGGRNKNLPTLNENRREKELRILNAFDLEVCCVGGPCILPNAPEG